MAYWVWETMMKEGEKTVVIHREGCRHDQAPEEPVGGQRHGPFTLVESMAFVGRMEEAKYIRLCGGCEPNNVVG